MPTPPPPSGPHVTIDFGSAEVAEAASALITISGPGAAPDAARAAIDTIVRLGPGPVDEAMRRFKDVGVLGRADLDRRMAALHALASGDGGALLREYGFSPKKGLAFGRKDGRLDQTVIKLDGAVLFDNVPQTSYTVNGRTPVANAVDRFKVKIDRPSGIVNDPCLGVDLAGVIERAVYVGQASERIIDGLPAEFEPPPSSSGAPPP